MRLAPHPSTPLPAPCRLTAHCDVSPGTLRLRWTLQADLERIRLPPARMPARRSGLWRHTCFELFVADPAGEGYREFNFSPSSEWAAYGFMRYREGMTELELAQAPQIALAVSAGQLLLTVTMPRTAVGAASGAQPSARRCALAAVIEHVDGGLAYLALAHPAGRPDFHHRDGFAGELCL